MTELIIASNNPGKIREAKEILDKYEIIPMSELNVIDDIEENQDTIEGNARQKAEELSKLLNGKIVIADDTGILIDCLDGFPGVHTKRWMPGTDRDRNLGILEKLEGVPKEKRQITNVTAVAVSNGKETYSVTGEIKGYVTTELRGKNGFGFDEIFELENGKTLAEISEEEKNRISARKQALEKIKEKITKIV